MNDTKRSTRELIDIADRIIGGLAKWGDPAEVEWKGYQVGALIIDLRDEVDKLRDVLRELFEEGIFVIVADRPREEDSMSVGFQSGGPHDMILQLDNAVSPVEHTLKLYAEREEKQWKPLLAAAEEASGYLDRADNYPTPLEKQAALELDRTIAACKAAT